MLVSWQTFVNLGPLCSSCSWPIFTKLYRFTKLIMINWPVKMYYYSFTIFLHFWLAKITRIIHQNQLPLNKFVRILRYWSDDVNCAAKLPDYWTINQEDLGMRLSCVGSDTSLKTRRQLVGTTECSWWKFTIRIFWPISKEEHLGDSGVILQDVVFLIDCH